MDKICLVIGAGAGIGGTVAKRFAKEGYILIWQEEQTKMVSIIL